MNTLTLQKNDVVFRQEDFADTMYKLLNGSVRIITDYGKESEKELALLKDGDFFGEMGMIACFPRTATAVVCSETAEITEFGVEDYGRLFKDDPDNVMKILHQLADRIRETDESYLEAVETVQKAKADGVTSEEDKRVLKRLRDRYYAFIGR